MFETKTYADRRKQLKQDVSSGLILMPGSGESAMNYPGNPYYYRQDSSFLYFFGIDKPGFYGLIDVDGDKDYIFGTDFTIDDIIWMGPQPAVKYLAAAVGVDNTGAPAQLKELLDKARSAGKKIHFLPPYRGENILEINNLTGIPTGEVKKEASLELIKAVVKQREIKSAEEVAEIEKSLDISSEMYKMVMQMAKPGTYEREITGRIEGIVGSAGSFISFPVILTTHGETLHNHYHGNKLEKHDLLVVDSGAESPLHYASDITRTFPVGGKFTPEQKDIYQVVYAAVTSATEAITPGKMNKEIHLQTAKVIAAGLKDLGLMKGDLDAAVKEGAHALFFPHGLGHMMGLDVHDMEDLGEDNVGYDDTVVRSRQFGLAYLRLAKELKPGFVLTVEPGIYFIPALIDQWHGEKRFADFINYDQVSKYKGFGGIRIEDDVLVTDNGFRVLGKPIPKTAAEIEEIMA
ncbi:MAG: aminopeptidase P family protein [Candidatus Aminicenantes bacterium]|nr:aminopeptidase P family protein [Candidatus Aminicenantes bacterium]